MSGEPISSAAWIAAFARAAAFAASVPLGASGAIPNAVRAVLAIGLTPAIVSHVEAGARRDVAPEDIAINALVGIAFGLAATVVAAAVSSAGALLDATLASAAVIGRDPLGGSGGGPMARLYSLAFGVAFFSSGAMTHLCERFASAAPAAAAGIDAASAVALVRACFASALSLAAPAIVAQLLGTIVAAFTARAAPRVNGLMLSSPLVSALLLVMVLAAAPTTMAGIAALARAAAAAPAL